MIDRLGYHHRYHKKFGDKKWSLCRSSFGIGVDRAAKFAQDLDRRLNVFVERSDRKTDTFQVLVRAGRLIDAHVSDEHQRIKYYCFGRTELAPQKHA